MLWGKSRPTRDEIRAECGAGAESCDADKRVSGGAPGFSVQSTTRTLLYELQCLPGMAPSGDTVTRLLSPHPAFSKMQTGYSTASEAASRHAAGQHRETPAIAIQLDDGAVLDEAIWSECAHLWTDPAAIPAPPSLIDRAFTKYFVRSLRDKQGYDQFVYQHFNGLCLVGLAPSHAALQAGEGLTFVALTPNPALQPSAPRKLHNARPCNENNLLCTLERSDGRSFPIMFGVCGCFVEYNPRLVPAQSTPDGVPSADYIARLNHLLRSKTDSEGYLAVIVPKTKGSAPLTTLKYIETKEQYEATGHGGGCDGESAGDTSNPTEGGETSMVE